MNGSIEISQLNDAFSNQIRQIISSARNDAVRSVDFCRVQMYWKNLFVSAVRTQFRKYVEKKRIK